MPLSHEEAVALGLEDGPPAAPAPQRSFLQRTSDAVADALPPALAAVGGVAALPEAAALALPSFGTSAALVPAGGALGHLSGTQLKRLLDYFSGRDTKMEKVGGTDTLLPHDPVGSATQGGKDAMLNYSLGAAPQFSRLVEPVGQSVASQVGPRATQFANLSQPAFEKVWTEGTLPARRPMAPAVSEAASKGMKYATPEVAGSALRGTEQLRSLSAQDTEALKALLDATKGQRMSQAIRPEMRSTVDELADASGRALDKVSEVMPRRELDPQAMEAVHFDSQPIHIQKPIQGRAARNAASSQTPPAPEFGRKIVTSRVFDPVQGPGEAPGGDVLNKGFNEPWSQNSVVRSKPAMQSIADVKDAGLRQAALGDKLGEAERMRIGASAYDTAGRDATTLARDASELEGSARAMSRQRAGAQQDSPKAHFGAIAAKGLGRILNAPKSTLGGWRPESLENAALEETPRMLEIEAARRGLPAKDAAARAAAFRDPVSPLKQSIRAFGDKIDPAEMQGAAALLREWLKR